MTKKLVLEKCFNCGAKIRSRARYCHSCGRKLKPPKYDTSSELVDENATKKLGADQIKAEIAELELKNETFQENKINESTETEIKESEAELIKENASVSVGLGQENATNQVTEAENQTTQLEPGFVESREAIKKPSGFFEEISNQQFEESVDTEKPISKPKTHLNVGLNTGEEILAASSVVERKSKKISSSVIWVSAESEGNLLYLIVAVIFSLISLVLFLLMLWLK